MTRLTPLRLYRHVPPLRDNASVTRDIHVTLLVIRTYRIVEISDVHASMCRRKRLTISFYDTSNEPPPSETPVSILAA